MDKISRNSDILRRILESASDMYYPRKHLVACTVVCKLWSEIALDLVWHEVSSDDFYHVFNILAPLHKSDEGQFWTYVWQAKPTTADWTCFERYRHRIRVLKLMPYCHFLEHGVDKTVFNELTLSSPPSGLFPNVTVLDLDTRSDYFSPLFLTPVVTVLRMELAYPREEDLRYDRPDILHHVSLQLSNIRELSFWVSGGGPMFGPRHFSRTIQAEEHKICELIRKKLDLQVLSLPACWFTTHVAEATASLTCLKKVLVNKTDGNPLDTLTFNPVLPQQTSPKIVTHPIPKTRICPPFSSLQEFSAILPYPKFQQFLVQWIPTGRTNSHLKQLSIRSQVLESPQTLQQLLETLAARCPSLLSLRLSSLCSSEQMPQKNGWAYGDTNDPLTTVPQSPWTLQRLYPFRVKLSTVSPLFALKSLVSCDLHHHLPPAFSSSDLETIAYNLSHLHTLHLFPDPHPIYLGKSKDTPTVFDEVVQDLSSHNTKRVPELQQTLRTFGLNCPKLQKLGIFVYPDLDSDEVGDEDWELHHQVNCFPVLTELLLGTSPCDITTANSVAFILSKYLRPGTKITASYSWNRHTVTAPYLQRLVQGGKVLDPPSKVPQSKSVEETEFKENNGQGNDEVNGGRSPSTRPNPPWRYHPDGRPLTDDRAVLVDLSGDPLVFDFQTFLEDPVMHGTMGGVMNRINGEKWMPGVSLVGSHDSVIELELKERKRGWVFVNGFLPLTYKVKAQERRLSEGT
ncbi:hypothetical protein BDN72DRAFT_844529 [Pluteus cervinus]|uniref:Uncharacterized protein n=1 Tax=Pluteus cervinus TaxID=181527 RepID=A0ACD3AKU1_9AGAR|nr:hypothetical protein BDN72DRAFT_844529 [Pluteus cervinus]